MYIQSSSNYPVSQPMTQQYQPESSAPNQNYGPVPSYQQASYHGVATSQAHDLSPSQFQATMQPPPVKAAQLHPMLSGAGQGTTDGFST
ncbi:hypothetical protein Bca4012_018220 [Brassica carinata]|uniref:Uncharacterized protein n=1 Tax=Brassica carinata TaxID=52824 RepID=A0A8X7WJR2_BRACI|nr:hypothetical protein Bca52824_003384 [Brassica carinata]